MKNYLSNKIKICFLTILVIVGALLSQVNLGIVSAHNFPDTTPQDYESFFDQTISEQLNNEHIAGATVAVVKDGEIVFSKGYGFADVDAQIPVDANNTLFFIGSDGKLFTWTAVMQLVEQGKLDLNADINSYLDFQIPNTFPQPITMHHLMTHTAGFEDEFNSLLQNDPSKLLPLREHLIHFMPERVFVPGEVMAYSNYGTALAGYIIERVSGQTYEDYISQNLLQSLGMSKSFAGNTIPAQFEGALSKGYRFENGQFQPLDFEFTAALPAAPIRTTATDISRFMIAHLNGGCVEENCILKSETVDLMHRQQFTHDPQMSGMAYGFLETTINGQRVLWHMGESARFITLLALLPEQNLGLFISYNTAPAGGHEMLFRFLDAFYPVNRQPLNSQPLAGWEERARQFNGSYFPARSNFSSQQILVAYAQSAPILIDQGKLDFDGMQFIETEPGIFHQEDGDRTLVFKENEKGERWFYMGVLAYFQVPWYRSTSFIFPLVIACVVLFISAWLIWSISALRKKKSSNRPTAGVLWLAGTLGLFELGLFAILVAQLIQYGTTYVFPQETVNTISYLYWVAIPWTITITAKSIQSWLQNRWSLAWRIHYSLGTLAAIAMIWLAYSLNLFRITM